MTDDELLILRAGDVGALLAGQEQEIIETVRSAYELYAGGDSSLPHSTFLRFPKEPRNRIIALPAYLDGEFDVAGVKWISSFPNNLDAGLDRASAVIVLNSAQTGRPRAVIEGSIISAKRTAASAALAARYLHQAEGPLHLGLIGCGVINFEIVRFVSAVFPDIAAVSVFDIDAARVERFTDKCREFVGAASVTRAARLTDVLGAARLVSVATTALKPHIDDLSMCAPGTTILHVSLRDLTSDMILDCDNIVDDIDHVCRAETSIHLAEQSVGNRDFIRCPLADITSGRAPARKSADAISVFSPFGLGVLDLAVADMVCRAARRQGKGTLMSSFLPEAWDKRP